MEMRRLKTQRTINYWRGTANMIDSYSRVGFPALYLTLQGVLWNLEMTDTYLMNPASEMHNLVGPMKMSAEQVWNAMIVPLAFISIASALVVAHFLGRKKRDHEQEQARANARSATMASFGQSAAQAIGSIGSIKL
eukprot:4988926-Prymnesium_polylepis.1